MTTKRILNYFGYITKEAHEEILSKEKKVLTDKIRSLESLFEIPTSMISNRDYLLQKPEAPWNQYWEECCADPYDAFHIRVISKDPTVLVNLISAIRDFDFKSVDETMKKLNWTWNNNTHSPTLKNMQSNVLELCHSAFVSFNSNGKENKVSSGGFDVSILEDKTIKIVFLKSDFHPDNY